MKPLGIRPVRFPGKTDCHPERGYVNWWENTVSPNKKRDRQQAKRDISEAIRGH